MDTGKPSREDYAMGSIRFTLLMFSMAACLPLFFLGPIAYGNGLSLGEALLGALLGNLVVVILLSLNGKYGVKYRKGFGPQAKKIFGKYYKIPVFLRGLVGALWYGVEAFNGALAIVIIALFTIGYSGQDIVSKAYYYLPVALAIYVALIIAFFKKGVRGIGKAAELAGPALFLYFAWLALWISKQPTQPTSISLGVGITSAAFLTYLAVQTNWWATVAVNISDLSKGAKDWKTVWIGAVVGLLGGQLVGTYLGYKLALQTGHVLPHEIILNAAPGTIPILLGLLFAFLAPWTTDLSANLPALSDLIEEVFSIDKKKAAVIAGLSGFLLAPWYLLENAQSIVNYVTAFASSYGVLLGPILGVMLAYEYIHAKTDSILPIIGLFSGIAVSYAASYIIGDYTTLSFLGVPVPFPGPLSWFIGVASSFLLVGLGPRLQLLTVGSSQANEMPMMPRTQQEQG